MFLTKENLLGHNIIQDVSSTNKISIVGTGQVGMACAYALICQNICNELSLTDTRADKLQGEFMDLQHGLPFVKNMKIESDTNLKVTANSNIIIITAGVRQVPDESRLSLVQRNLILFKDIIPKLVEYSPNTIFLVISNPVDVLAFITWKLSGLPANRIIGSGTNLDSARFRHFIGEKLGISPHSCHAWIIGEHGDSSIAVWNGINVAGVGLNTINPKIGTDDDPEHWKELHKQVVESANKIIKLKGYTSWAIGLSAGIICNSILRNEKQVIALSTYVKNWNQVDKYGICEDVFLSLPSVVGSSGIISVVAQNLSIEEIGKLKDSAKKLDQVQKEMIF